MLQSRKEEASLGLVHLGVFVLLLLSGERTFGVALNSPHFSNTYDTHPLLSLSLSLSLSLCLIIDVVFVVVNRWAKPMVVSLICLCSRLPRFVFL
jgi:hypothetical protein